MATECPKPIEELQKDISIDSLHTDFFPYNITKDPDHPFDKRSHLLHDHLKAKLEEPTVNGTEKNGKSGIELQLEKSENRLEELLNFGNELVNNIKIYNEKQEVTQNQSKTARLEDLQESLNEEALESLSNFNKISDKWGIIMQHKEPMVVNEQLQKQKEAIFELFNSKDAMIDRCQKELKRVNEKYLADQNKQSTDIYFLIERIDSQIELMKKAYKENIYELQNTIDNERQKFQRECEKKWKDLYTHLTVEEVKKQETVKEKHQFYAKKLETIIAKQEEITRTTKVRLEKDAELMELEIRKTRANVLLNSEKIDYNYQVLQKRNEENVIINNQQKRRVAKLNENIVTMKRRLAQLKRSNKQITNHLSADIHKLHGNINDMHSKAEYFRRANVQKFHKIWDINFKEVKEYFASIMEIDRILYEQQLAREWKMPDIDLDKLELTKAVKTC
uniref:Dynein regulatory complex protein 1/2 N-terminal domain-containing protein n=2 Tax=Glossina brevipalpis TaxID=37001 RepID=A0A1A9WAC2_9MUSC